MTSRVDPYESPVGSLARCRNLARYPGLVLLALLLGGCVTVQYGVAPQTDRLGELSIGESRRGDVLLVLGQPRGKGAANVLPERDPRAIWFYEYVESDGKAVRVKMLLIYFDGDVYDGYFWFSSVEDISS